MAGHRSLLLGRAVPGHRWGRRHTARLTTGPHWAPHRPAPLGTHSGTAAGHVLGTFSVLRVHTELLDDPAILPQIPVGTHVAWSPVAAKRKKPPQCPQSDAQLGDTVRPHRTM